MSFSSFSQWLLLRESKRRKPRLRIAKNSAIDGFIRSVEELERDVEKLSKQKKSPEKNKKKEKEKVSEKDEDEAESSDELDSEKDEKDID